VGGVIAFPTYGFPVKFPTVKAALAFAVAERFRSYLVRRSIQILIPHVFPRRKSVRLVQDLVRSQICARVFLGAVLGQPVGERQQQDLPL
jgi:hypothetical protein